VTAPDFWLAWLSGFAGGVLVGVVGIIGAGLRLARDGWHLRWPWVS